MVSYCPNCGSEAKEGYMFCINCGANLQFDSRFEEQATRTPVVNTPAQMQQPIPQQPYYQTQGYVPFQPRKSNKKLIAGIIAIIVAVVIIVAIVFILFDKNTNNNNNNSSDFFGTWRLDSAVLNGNITPAPVEMTFTFNSDGTYEVTAFGSPDTTGTWSASNGKLYTPNSNTSVPPSMDYQFSNDKNTLTLSYSMDVGDQTYQMSLILKRTSSSSNSNGGNSNKLDEELDANLVGNWILSSMIINGQSTPLSDITIDFNSDGTYNSAESTYANETGTWHTTNGKLFFQVSSGYSMFYAPTGMDYQLTNDGDTLTLGYSTSYNDQTYSMSYIFERS